MIKITVRKIICITASGKICIRYYQQLQIRNMFVLLRCLKTLIIFNIINHDIDVPIDRENSQ